MPWTDPPGERTWRNLLKSLIEGLDEHADKVQSLRVMAAALLVLGPLASTFGRSAHPALLAATPAQRLAETLVHLSSIRNELTHRRSGTPAQADAARKLAIEAASLVCQMR